MSEAGERLIAGATEALAIARGEEPAASITVNGHRYVPAAEITRLQKEIETAREALDELAQARRVWMEASRTYNDRLAIARQERERGNWSIKVHAEYLVLGEAQGAFIETAQDVADRALKDKEVADG